MKFINESQELKDIHEVKNIEYPLQCHGVIYLKSLSCILMIGGVVDETYYDLIHEYSLKDKEWKLWNEKLPTNLYSFGLAATVDEKYLIIAGGAPDDDTRSDNIYVLD